MLKISTSPPPIMDRIEKAFGVTFDSGVIITYGDTVHVKSGKLSPDVEVHEETHIKQQSTMNLDEWCDKYFDDPKFRLEQELEAYHNQVKWIKKNIKDRNRRFLLIEHICKSISSNYGEMITYDEAKKIITL